MHASMCRVADLHTRNSRGAETLEHARQQLKRSDELRRGALPSSVYEPGLQGGTRFSTQLRTLRKGAALSLDEKYLVYEHEKQQVGATRGCAPHTAAVGTPRGSQAYREEAPCGAWGHRLHYVGHPLTIDHTERSARCPCALSALAYFPFMRVPHPPRPP
jgi:hypothetical protein